jgi:DNA-3-methyladenine glycosylase II
MEQSRRRTPGFVRAQRHLSRRDPILHRLIKRLGPCTLRHDPDGFGVLVRAIVAQQISTRAARAIAQRLHASLGETGICPEAILRTRSQKLRRAGLSAGKVLSLRDLADRCARGELNLQSLPSLPDEEVIARLVPVRGIGRWTAEMYLIFCLGRMDVLPLSDFGLRAGVQKSYDLQDLPGKMDLQGIAEPWRPYRSVGTWFIWRSLGNVPQS